MQSIDAFGKPVDEFKVKTACGGYLSICSILLIVVLFLNELWFFLEPETKDVLAIDENQDKKYLDISLNISFPKIPCSILYVNLVDNKKLNVMHVVHNIYKQRLGENGKPLGKAIRDGLRDTCQSAGELKQTMLYEQEERAAAHGHASAKLRCGSCYQAHIDEDDCCTSCEAAEASFEERGWSLPKDYVFEQCESKAYAEQPAQDNEGCRLSLGLHVRKVASQILIGVGKFYKHDFLPQSYFEQASKGILDFSHKIGGLSFGPKFPGLVDVLEGRVKQGHLGEGTEHYQYDVHVIPTRYAKDWREILGAQYSVTEYKKNIDPKERQNELVAAGLYINYDFTPFEVKVSVERKKLSHFLTECCAILGGIFAFSGMLDSMAYRFSKILARRIAPTISSQIPSD